MARRLFLASSETSAEVENAIDIALKVADALHAVLAEYFVGGSSTASFLGAAPPS